MTPLGSASMAAGTVALAAVRLPELMARTSGDPAVRIGLVDGPVATGHPALARARVRAIGPAAACGPSAGEACAHGTTVAGILVAARDSGAPGICPDCTLLVRPIFRDGAATTGVPLAASSELAQAVVECVAAGARVVNISAATGRPATSSERSLVDALDHAAARGVLVVAAAGNQAAVGSSVITRHPSVIAVAAFDDRGRPLSDSNLGSSVGRRGLGAPGEAIPSLDPAGGLRLSGGTSCAAAFVTGTIALLLSAFPDAGPGAVRHAIAGAPRHAAITPPPLDAAAAAEVLKHSSRAREMA